MPPVPARPPVAVVVPPPPPPSTTVNWVTEELEGIVIAPVTVPPAAPAAPDAPPPPPAPFIVNEKVVTPAGMLRVCVPAVVKATVANVVPWNEALAALVQCEPSNEESA
jgi:hypothetical protein